MATTTISKPVRLPTSTRYEFFEAIGTGGAGTVFRGRDRITNLPVAIKVLKAALTESPQQHYRFAQEFRSATRLEHPNIVRAIDFGTDGTLSFLVYDLVDGQSLGEKIEKTGRLPEREAVRIVTQVAQALHYAHQRRVIHRDVKPDNILILGDGRAKLTDFGLAKDYDNDQGLTRHASGLGTPYFVAPEQFANAKTADARCDVYSLGATLYNAVTGKLPFQGKWGLAILAKKEAKDLVSAKELVPELSKRVNDAIRAALDPDPACRPPTCFDFFKLLTARTKFDSDDGSVFDLQAVGPAGPADRRAWTRHPLDLGTCGTVNTSVHGGPETEESWPLIVRDVSIGGIGLLLARRFELGTELTVDLGGGPDARIMAKVVRLEHSEVGHWIHGCVFANSITSEELAGLVKFAQPPLSRLSSGSGSVPASPASSRGRPAPDRPKPPG